MKGSLRLSKNPRKGKNMAPQILGFTYLILSHQTYHVIILVPPFQFSTSRHPISRLISGLGTIRHRYKLIDGK